MPLINTNNRFLKKGGNKPNTSAELEEFEKLLQWKRNAEKKKAESVKRSTLEAKEAKAKSEKKTPAVSKWDAPAGSHLSSVANDIPAAKVPDYLLRPDNKPQRD